METPGFAHPYPSLFFFPFSFYPALASLHSFKKKNKKKKKTNHAYNVGAMVGYEAVLLDSFSIDYFLRLCVFWL